MEINLTKFLDFPIEKPADDSGSKTDLTLTLALPYYAEKLAKASMTSNGDPGENKGNGNRCSTCGKSGHTTWRKGPDGPKTLCNACGLRHLRSERKASGKRKMELMLRTETEELESLDAVRHSKRLGKRARKSFSKTAN